MIRLKALIKEVLSSDDYEEWGKAFAYDDEKQLIVFKNGNVYNIKNDKNVKFVKKINRKEIDMSSKLGDAGIIKNLRNGNLEWDF